MLTPFGKAVRKIRIDKNMKLMDMAAKLDVTPSFLTAVEKGRKSIPSDFPERVTNALKENSVTLALLKNAADLSKQVHKIVVGENPDDRDREVAAMFARTFPDLDDEQKTKIKNILCEEQEGT